MTYDQIGALNSQIVFLSGTVINYMKSVANYEKGIKRLRRAAWSGRQAKERVRTLENMILRAGCRHDADQCIRFCLPEAYLAHSEAREIRSQRRYVTK